MKRVRHRIVPQASAEQKEVVDAISDGLNVQIIALAGTGKTTTGILIAEHHPHLNILVLTYNRNLADEANAAFESYGMTNITCRTIHTQIGLVATSSARKRIICKTDRDVLRVLQQWSRTPPSPVVGIDLVILDEAQDLRSTTREALHHILPRVELNTPQLAVMGDPHQLLYSYDKHDPADPKFLLNATVEFAEHSAGRWCEKRLTTSYRITPNAARFINIMWKTSIVPGNMNSGNAPVEYWAMDPYGRTLTNALEALLNEEGCENVVFLNLANLVNKDTNAERPIKKHINRLLQITDDKGKRRFNFHTQQNETEKRTSTKNKVRAWTFCSSKGCTFSVVVVFGFSIYNGILPNMNQVCVALSRAQRRLIVIHNVGNTSGPQPYIPPLSSRILRSLYQEGVIVCPYGIPADASIPARPPPRTMNLPVTGLTHLSAKSIDHLLQMGTRSVSKEEDPPIPYTTTRTFHTGASSSEEDVSPIYGTGIMFAVEYIRTQRISHIEEFLAPLSPDANIRYTTDAFADMVLRAIGHPLTSSELGVIDEAMKAGRCTTENTTTMSGAELIQLIHTSRAEFPTLQGHGLRDRRSHDELFTKAYKASVQKVYESAEKTPSDYMFLANASLAFEGTHEVFVQIGEHDYDCWVESDVFQEAVHRVLQAIPDVCEFEVDMCVPFEEVLWGDRNSITGITGRVDVFYDETSIEVKFCSCLGDEHELQNLLYAAINCIVHGKETGRAMLFNARTNGCIVQEVTRDDAWRLLHESARMKL